MRKYITFRDFMVSLSHYNKETEIIQTFHLTFRYLDYLLNIDIYFEGNVGRIYPPEL